MKIIYLHKKYPSRVKMKFFWCCLIVAVAVVAAKKNTTPKPFEAPTVADVHYVVHNYLLSQTDKDAEVRNLANLRKDLETHFRNYKQQSTVRSNIRTYLENSLKKGNLDKAALDSSLDIIGRMDRHFPTLKVKEGTRMLAEVLNGVLKGRYLQRLGVCLEVSEDECTEFYKES